MDDLYWDDWQSNEEELRNLRRDAEADELMEQLREEINSGQVRVLE